MSILPFLSLACSKDPTPPPTLPQLTRGPCSISGTITLLGRPLDLPSKSIACDPRPDAPKILIHDKTVVVDTAGHLADTFIFITASSAHPTLKGAGTAEPAQLLDQKDCDFVPHALALQTGQALKLRNSDPTFHNVHWDPDLNRPSNLGFGPAPISPERIVAFTAPEFVKVRCDVHPWMTATIAVFDHPFFAVSNEKGQYTIPNLPPGTYTLTTYHPFYGPGTPQQITLSPPAQPPSPPAPPTAPTSVNFQYTSQPK